MCIYLLSDMLMNKSISFSKAGDINMAVTSREYTQRWLGLEIPTYTVSSTSLFPFSCKIMQNTASVGEFCRLLRNFTTITVVHRVYMNVALKIRVEIH